jgi:hypothetical protein
VQARLKDLVKRFRAQQAFSTGYSPLYACCFQTIADWLEEGVEDPLVKWLLSASSGRGSMDVTLLLLAGIHRDILKRDSELAPLAQYYPSVGGNQLCDTADFRQSLRDAIMRRREALFPFIQTATVQTNETGRGISWLLPLLLTSWDFVHLVDLGASAGLNLVADSRSYRLVERASNRRIIDLGKGRPVQFVMRSEGPSDQLLGASRAAPRILSRTGCDIAPYQLATDADELTLAAFVWADQPERLERLREATASLRRNNAGAVPVRLHTANLPAGLSRFLEREVPAAPVAPVLIYNTYMTVYLADKGAGLRHHLANWASTQERPVLWIQWEPNWGGTEPPEVGWCAWSADLWEGAEHSQWRLGWVQPHGTDVQWEPGLNEWVTFWQSSRATSC